ncbi:MAG: hypothetical protein BYD32DRAFT_112055 [Podila humilis]|nr:MAG: hypothetical protein BYD32DRAFT_112055 [Podila humilis]
MRWWHAVLKILLIHGSYILRVHGGGGSHFSVSIASFFLGRKEPIRNHDAVRPLPMAYLHNTETWKPSYPRHHRPLLGIKKMACFLSCSSLFYSRYQGVKSVDPICPESNRSKTTIFAVFMLRSC